MNTPQLLVTQYDEDAIPVANEHLAVPSDSVRSLGIQSSVPVLQHDIDRESAPPLTKRHSSTPFPQTLAAESFDTPKLLGRSKSLGVPEPVQAQTAKRNFSWNQQLELEPPGQSKSHCKLDVKCHIPYEPPEDQKGKTDLDLVIVYIYREGIEDAHRTFFECTVTSSDPRDRQTRSGPVSNGDARASENYGPDRSLVIEESKANNEKRDAPAQVINWLKHRHMLPKALPFCRILCVGYAINPKLKDKRIDFEKASKELIQQLTRERVHCRSRPTAIVAHGYGCRIVQGAIETILCGGKENDPFLEHCTGGLFYNAPHDDADPLVSELGMVAEKRRPEPPKTENTAPPKSDQKASVTGSSKLAKSMQELSCLHHFHHHGHSGKNQPHTMCFSEPCDRNFQLICSKIVEWFETDQLLHAVRQTDYTRLRHLIENGIDINQRKNASLESALHVACQTVDSRSHHIELLLKSGNADVAFQDRFGKTALHYAVARARPDFHVIRLLLQSNAHPRVQDKDGKTPLGIAKSSRHENPTIYDLLRKPPLVEGPSATKGSVTTAQPHSPLARQACAAFHMAATEMYYNRDTLTEKHLPRHFSVQEAIYGRKPLQKLLDETRRSGIKEELVCRWYHLPANNMVWVEDLFRNRFGIHPAVWSEQIRNSEWPHGRCIIPHASQFTTSGGDEREDVVAICMPYVSFEDNWRHVGVRDTVNTQSQPDVDDHVLPSNIYRLWKQERRRSTQRYDSSPTLSPPRMHSHGNESTSGTEKSFGSSFGSERTMFSEHVPDHSPIRKSSNGESDSDSEDNASDHDSVHTSRSRLSNEERLLVSAYLHHRPPLHARRTLDQYYYYMLQDTRERDADQVVTRWATKHLKRPHHNILMVDQLWLWIIKGKGKHPDRIISCFPERKGVDSGCLNDLQHNVLNWDLKGRKPIASTADLCSRIIATCSNVFSWSQEAELVRFLHFFEATVGRIGDDEIRGLKEFRDWSDDLHRLNKRQSNYAKRRDDLLIRMLDIRPQIALLEEAKDIRDEINIILSVLGEQSRVLRTETATEFFRPDGDIASDECDSRCAQPLRIINKAIGDFEKMDKQTKEVQDGLNHLLDLQQKQASVWEARSAREGARATSKQSTVMVIFTMVTIIFLPLSFMASFFALDVAEFPSDDRGQTNWPLHRVCTLLFGLSFGVITPFIALAFATDLVVSLFYQVKYGWLVPGVIKFLHSAKALGGVSHKERCDFQIERLDRHRLQYYQDNPKRTEKPPPHDHDRPLSAHDTESRSQFDDTDKEEDSSFDGKQKSSHIPLWRQLRRRRSRSSMEARV